jgi:hypothetical protein
VSAATALASPSAALAAPAAATTAATRFLSVPPCAPAVAFTSRAIAPLAASAPEFALGFPGAELPLPVVTFASSLALEARDLVGGPRLIEQLLQLVE